MSVSAEAADTITRRTAVTNGQGVATLEALAPSAQYTITVALQGFKDQMRQSTATATRMDDVSSLDTN